VAPQLIFNQRLDAWLTMFFLAMVWFVILDMARVSIRYLRGLPVCGSSRGSLPGVEVDDMMKAQLMRPGDIWRWLRTARAMTPTSATRDQAKKHPASRC